MTSIELIKAHFDNVYPSRTEAVIWFKRCQICMRRGCCIDHSGVAMQIQADILTLKEKIITTIKKNPDITMGGLSDKLLGEKYRPTDIVQTTLDLIEKNIVIFTMERTLKLNDTNTTRTS